MAKQFGQVIDSQHVMFILLTVRQGQDETVQMYFDQVRHVYVWYCSNIPFHSMKPVFSCCFHGITLK